jgi:predicted transcriptional regulator
MIGYQEVKQYKEEWGIVMQKLANVGSVLVDVGEMCRKHDLKEEELPPNLRTVLGSLEKCVLFLDAIFHMLMLIKGLEWD